MTWISAATIAKWIIKMKIGLFTSGYQYLDLEKAFADAKALDYDYIELWGGFPHAYPMDMDQERIEQINSLSKKYNIQIPIYTPEHNGYPYNYMLADTKQLERIIEYFYKAIETARKLGCKYMLISSGHGGENSEENERTEKLIKFLNIITEKAEKEDIILLLETLTPYESNTCTTLSDLKKVLDSISSPHLIGMCDVVAAYSQGETIEDYLEVLGDKLGHIHLVDYDGETDNHLIPGEGILDIKAILTSLKENNYKGRITIELVTHYIEDPTSAFKKSIEYIRNLKIN